MITYIIKRTKRCSGKTGPLYSDGVGFSIEKPTRGTDINSAHKKFNYYECGCEHEIIEVEQ
jgi:hypothetical protein